MSGWDDDVPHRISREGLTEKIQFRQEESEGHIIWPPGANSRQRGTFSAVAGQCLVCSGNG